MKKIYIWAIALTLGMGFTACSDQLNIPKPGNMGSEEEFYKTDSDMEQAITSCYTTWGGLIGSLKSTDDFLSDDVWCGGGQRNDDARCENLGSYTFGTTNENIQGLFTGLYTLIYNSNLILERFEAYDTPVKKRDLAEAHFFRGLAHFYLGAFFGTAPVVDHRLPENEYSLPNCTKAELFAQAIKDLKTAVESGNLTSKSDVNAIQTRISKEGAEALLGKAYIFNGNYAAAVPYLDNVINSGLYQLSASPLEDILHKKCDYDPERVIEYNVVSDYNNLRWDLYFLQRGFRSDFYNWNCSDPDITNSGYGFFNPTKSLYDAFVSEEGTNGYRLNQTIKTESQINAMGITILPGKVIHGHEGYWNWKQRMLNSDYIVYGGFAVANPVAMRYAEVLLLAAEANLQAGNTGTALNYLNQVRTRAQLPNKSAITMDDIKLEKRLELWGEGCRWMDLVRWGDAQAKLQDKGKAMPGYKAGGNVIVEYTNADAGFKAGKNEVLPIPDKQIKLSHGVLHQNPNY